MTVFRKKKATKKTAAKKIATSTKHTGKMVRKSVKGPRPPRKK